MKRSWAGALIAFLLVGVPATALLHVRYFRSSAVAPAVAPTDPVVVQFETLEEVPSFFDPLTQEPLIWFAADPQGEVELYARGISVSPQTGRELQPVTRDVLERLRASRRSTPVQRAVGRIIKRLKDVTDADLHFGGGSAVPKTASEVKPYLETEMSPGKTFPPDTVLTLYWVEYLPDETSASD